MRGRPAASPALGASPSSSGAAACPGEMSCGVCSLGLCLGVSVRSSTCDKMCVNVAKRPPPREQGKRVSGSETPLPCEHAGNSGLQGPGGLPLAHGGRCSFPPGLLLVLMAPRVTPRGCSGRPQHHPGVTPRAPRTPDSTLGRDLTDCGSAGQAGPGEAGGREPGTALSNYRIRCAPRN